jgi:transcriptional regulator with XRE-family HTH domain
MTFRYQEIGDRLKAFRLASDLSADEIAKLLGISRTALYRFERGELAKIDTLERLADLLDVSIATLLGVGIEYIPSAVAYFERLRQLEGQSDHVIVLAGPLSYQLTSDNFDVILRQLLVESVPLEIPAREKALGDISKILEILKERRAAFRRRPPTVVNLISGIELERLLRNGFVGKTQLPRSEQEKRKKLAHDEVAHLTELIAQEPMGVQIGVVRDALPQTGFQIFRQPDRKVLTLSPFRLGENPNVRVGVAMITSAGEALALHERAVKEMWDTALKGETAADYMRSLMRSASEPTRIVRARA